MVVSPGLLNLQPQLVLQKQGIATVSVVTVVGILIGRLAGWRGLVVFGHGRN